MIDTEVTELVELANKAGISQAKVANHLGCTDNYWFKIRSGRMPASENILREIRSLKKKLRAFTAA